MATIAPVDHARSGRGGAVAQGLAGLRVVHAGIGLAPALVARLFATVGATVQTLGRADPLRSRYPAIEHWARGWEAIHPQQQDQIVAEADLLVLGGEDDPRAGSLPDGFDAPTLAAANSGLVVVDITGYVEATTPTAAVDLLVQAHTGLTFEHFSARPIQIAFAPTLYGAGLLGAIGGFAALVARKRTGRGEIVSVSLQQGMALFWPHLWMSATEPDALFDAVPPLDVRHLIFTCADGEFVQFVLGVPGALARVYAALDIDQDVDPTERGVPDPSRGPDDYFAERHLLAEAVARLDCGDVVARLAAAGIAAEPVLWPGECFDDAQVVHSGLVETASDGHRFGASPIKVAVVADMVAGDVKDGGAAGQTSSPRAADADTDGAPLDGIRVVDLGNWVAGPFASKLLADLGADVISVEPPTGLTNLTGLRNVLASNRGKRSIVLDLHTQEGRSTVDRLVATADVVHHNFRVGVAERLEVAADRLRQIRPDLVYLHTTAYGASGPRSLNSGFDMVMQALCGHERRAGGVADEPLWYRTPYIDYATGALGAFGMLAGLYERAIMGRAVDIETSLLGAALFVRGEVVQDRDGTMRGEVVLNDTMTGFRPSECLYEAADGWLALAVRDERMAAALGMVLGLPLPSDVDKWGAGEHDAIADAIGTQPMAELLDALAGADVWAARCERDGFARLRDDAAARRANLVIDVPDPRYGTVSGVFGPLITLSRPLPERVLSAAAPLPGQHTTAILIELADRPTAKEAS